MGGLGVVGSGTGDHDHDLLVFDRGEHTGVQRGLSKTHGGEHSGFISSLDVDVGGLFGFKAGGRGVDFTLGKSGNQELHSLVLSEGLLETRADLIESVGVHDAVQIGLVKFVNQSLVDLADVLALVQSPEGRVEHVVTDLDLGVAISGAQGELHGGLDVRGASNGSVVDITEYSGRKQAVGQSRGGGRVDVDTEWGGSQEVVVSHGGQEGVNLRHQGGTDGLLGSLDNLISHGTLDERGEQRQHLGSQVTRDVDVDVTSVD